MTRASPPRAPRGAELAEAVVLADLTLVLSIVSQVIPGRRRACSSSRSCRWPRSRRATACARSSPARSPRRRSASSCSAFRSSRRWSRAARWARSSASRARRGYGVGRTVGVAVVFLWPLVALIVDGLLLVFSSYRELLLDQFRNSWQRHEPLPATTCSWSFAPRRRRSRRPARQPSAAPTGGSRSRRCCS